ncbi:MAG TPA: HlyD family secretion protein [bacterium]|nr:HlyD family secretion protein [bacterium]
MSETKPVDGAATTAAPVGTAGRPRPRARRWLFGAIAALIVAAALYTVHYFSYAGTHPTTDDAFVQGDTAIISAKVFGRVSRVFVRGYQLVHKGEPLVELDPVDARIAAQQAQAALEAAQTRVRQAEAALVAQQHQASAALAQAQAIQAGADAHVPQSRTAVTLEDQTVRESISGARAHLSAATAQVTSARSNLDKSRNDLTRARELLAEGAIASQQVDQAQAAYDAAAAQERSAIDAVTQARASLAQAESTQLRVPIRRLDVTAAIAQQNQAAAGLETARAGFDVVTQREAELATARAGVAQAEAQLAAARQQLDYTTIFAPADAMVGSDVPIQPGQVVQPGQTLLTLVFSSRKWVQANFKETQLRGVRAGQPVSIRVDLLGRTFRGHVEQLGPATGAALSLLPAQNATGNFTKVVQRVPVRIALDDAPADLQVGLSVEATVDTTKRPAVARGAITGAR